MMPRALRPEQGAALILALMAMTVLMSLGAVLVMTTSTETAIAANFRSRREAFYAAEAAAELAVAELRRSASWAAFVDGSARSRFVDGAPDGLRALPSDAPINLTAIANLANCGLPAPCSEAPRWHLFAHGPLRDFTGAVDSPYYVVAFVQGAETEAGVPLVTIRAEAFGPRSSHQAIELTLSRSSEGGAIVLRAVFG
jgi:hypothetical protein